ncbi:MAG: hypothetical protein ACYC64_10820 [Armatimonadota bacterium]
MKTRLVLAACIAIAVAAMVTPVCSATLVGQWTFDSSNSTGPLENKAPGVSWSTMTLGGYDGNVSNGALVLPTWQDPNTGAWNQSYAYSMLTTDLGPSGYFQNSTQVIWIKWPGFDPTFWGRMTNLAKFATNEWWTGGQKAGEAIGYLDSTFANNTWGGYHMWEQVVNGNLITQPQWIRPLSPHPAMPTDKWVKLALVIQIVDPNTWQYSMYGDFGDGGGLTQIGITRQFDRATWSWVSSFGQSGTNCLEDPAGGLRYDGFGLMEWGNWVTPQHAGQIEFDEARVYSGAMTQAEIAALAPVVAPPSGASLVGHWTFDHYNSTGPLENKAPGVSWSTMALGGYDGKVSNGALVLPTWQDPNTGTWNQSYASTMLQTDLGVNGYSKEITQVIWLKWPGFDPTFFGRLTNLAKFASNEWWPGGQFSGDSILYQNGGLTWGDYRIWEELVGGNLTIGSSFVMPGGPNPPTDKLIKIAQVISYLNSDSYLLNMYGDFGDGSGMVQLGVTGVIPASQLNAFGQASSNCLIDPAGGPRYDGFGLMEWGNWVTPQRPSQIEFDEARVYTGAMSQSEIAALSPTAGTTVGTSIKSLYDPLAQTAAGMTTWTLWGKAIAIDPLIPDPDNFYIDDGSGKTAQVHYVGHGLVCDGTEYVSVTGDLEFNELGGAILRAGSITIQN